MRGILFWRLVAYTSGMSLTAQDKKEMREMMLDTVSLALEQIVIPRFENLEDKVDGLEGRMDRQAQAANELRGEVRELRSEMNGLRSEMNELRDEQRSTASSLHRRIDEVEGSLSSKITMLEDDIKEIYKMLDKLQKLSPAERAFAKLSIEQKVLQTEAQIAVVAKEAGVKLAFIS